MVIFDIDNPQTMVHKSLRTVPGSAYDQWNISMVMFDTDNPQTMVHKSLRTVLGSFTTSGTYQWLFLTQIFHKQWFTKHYAEN